MKLRRFGAPRETDANAAAPDKATPEQQRSCPQCGALISARAKTCLHCSADLGVPLDEHISRVLQAMQAIAPTLGLDGSLAK